VGLSQIPAMLSSNGLVNVKLAFIKFYFTSGTLTVYNYPHYEAWR
jgi:hypothetical protein